MNFSLVMVVIILVSLVLVFAAHKHHAVAVLTAAFASTIGIIAYDPMSSEDRVRAKEEQAKINLVPKPLSTVDGCTVYSFIKNEREHYFTRCENTVSTETNWTESCGKNCTKRMSSSIQTEVKK